LPTNLSHGRRKLVGVARALAQRPRLVLLDEPAAGLDTNESLELGARLKTMPDEGVTILLVDHDMGLVLGTCDTVHVLDFGRLIASGTPAEIRENQDVIAAYLGERVEVA
jgi:branched-chain amino acid transport system ATP-binding protein